jgi:hypothetical protein
MEAAVSAARAERAAADDRETSLVAKLRDGAAEAVNAQLASREATVGLNKLMSPVNT